jgi:hypothetical protein
MSLKEELAECRSGWFRRVPAERQAIMERHIAELRNGLARTSLKVGDRAPNIVLANASLEMRPSMLGRSGRRVLWCSHFTAAAGAPTAISNCGPFSGSFLKSAPPAPRSS